VRLWYAKFEIQTAGVDEDSSCLVHYIM